MGRTDTTFFFGDWQVDAKANTLRLGKQQISLEPKAMDVLALLCHQAGTVLSADEITQKCWPEMVGDNPLHKTITALRKALGDSATDPTYIETIRKRGYRTLAKVRFPHRKLQLVENHVWQQGSPFPGLEAFDASFSQVYFGRSKQIDTLLQAIARQVGAGHAFCLVLGPSGSGKSSLIHAGVLPHLEHPHGFHGVRVLSSTTLDLADVATDALYTSLASSLLDWELNNEAIFIGESAQSLSHKLQFSSEQLIYRCQKVVNAFAQYQCRFALVIDRLEILLSSPRFTTQERLSFVALLEQFAQSGAVLVLSACRNEFYPALATYPEMMIDKQRGAHFDLLPPSKTELQQMIRFPARLAGLSWQVDEETGLALDEQLCNEAADNPDGLPMLQYLLHQLYEQRDPNNMLLWQVYERLGGIEGAIGQTAEQVLSSLNQEQQQALPQVLSLLVTVRDDESVITSRSAPWRLLEAPPQQQLVQALVEQRLLVSHLDEESPSFSVAHEALLRRWPRASLWIKEHLQALMIKSRLLMQAKRWQLEQEHKAYLLAEGKPLQEALWLKTQTAMTFEPLVLQYIDASETRARSKRWVRRGTMMLLVILTIVALLMSVRSLNAERNAQSKRLAAEGLVGFMVGDFADKLRQIGRMDLLDGISSKALQYFTEFTSAGTGEYLSVESRVLHGQTLEAIGEVAYSRSNTMEASAALLAAREPLMAVLELQPNNSSVLKTLGANAFWLGQIEYDAMKWPQAIAYFEDYLHYSERMLELAPTDVDAMIELSYATNSLGSLQMKASNFTSASEYFEHSLQLKLKAYQLQPDNRALIGDIADTRSWLASAALAKGDVEGAVALHKEIQAEFGEAVQEDPYVVERVYSSYTQMAAIFQQQGHLKEAFEKNLLAFQLVSKGLNSDPMNLVWKRDQFLIKTKLLELNLELGDPRFQKTSDDLLKHLSALEQEYGDKSRMSQIKAQFWLVRAKDFAVKGNQQAMRETLNELKALLVELERHSNQLEWVRLFKVQKNQFYVHSSTELSTQSKRELCQETHDILSFWVKQDKSLQLVQAFQDAKLCLEKTS